MGPENAIRTSAGWPRRNERKFKILRIHTLSAIILATAITQGVPSCTAAPAFPRNHSPNHEKASNQAQSPAHEASEPGLELCPRACEGDDDFDCYDEDDGDDDDDGGDDNTSYNSDDLITRETTSDDRLPTVKLASLSLPDPLMQALQPELKQALASGLEQAGRSSTESGETSATAAVSDAGTQPQSTPATSEPFTSSETPVLPSSSALDVSGTPSTSVNAPTSLATTFAITPPLSSGASLPAPTFSTGNIPTSTNSDNAIETETTIIGSTTITTTTVSYSSSSHTSHTSHMSATFPSHKLNQGPGLAIRPTPGVDLTGGLSHDFDSTRGSHHIRATMVIGLIAAILTVSTALIFMLHLFLKTRKKRAERLSSRGSIRGFGAVEWIDSRKKDNWHPALGDTGKLAGSMEKSPPGSRRDSLLSHWLRLNPNTVKDGRNSQSRFSLLPRLGALLGRSRSTSGPAPKRSSAKKEKILDIRPYDLGSRFSVSSSDVPLDESFGTLASLQSLEVIDLAADDDHERLTPNPNRQNLSSLSIPTSPNVGEDLVSADLMGEQQTLLRASSVPIRRSKANIPAHARTRSAPEGPADPHSPAPEPLTPTIGKHKSQSQSMSAVTISSKYSSMPPCDSDWDISDTYRHSARGTLQSRKSERKSGVSNRVTAQSIGGNGWTSARNSDYTMYRRSDW
ncbi:hypothetical protein BDN71DRAFT_340309 [Pleurotus eryngii]|uniref:Uncharacterized protein n=1 Tax=Pleurotus eryngii TaxID=5323 RepID=A0A9P5ZK52_PLEER|nr:hypothetical protein BDN71DRAFT_340309 [Pleurotus eryngii]